MAAKKRPVAEYFGELPKSFDDSPFYGLQLDNEQLHFANTVINPDIDIVFVNAKAGTGKTTIATGVANILVQYGVYNGIVYIMSPYGERKQGWLPGTITEKSSVYFEAFYQALVTIHGEEYIITDIKMRMLQPRELFNAQGFPSEYIIDKDFEGKEYSKTKQVARCGNAVTPPVATALVRANLPEYCEV